jgi:hypothetical protein
MMKYIVAAFIAIGAMLSVSAQAAPLSPAFVQAEQAIATGVAVEKVCWGGGCGWGGGYGGWGGGGCGWRPCWRPRPCGYYGYGCGVRWWPARPAWGWGGGYGGWGGGYGGWGGW